MEVHLPEQQITNPEVALDLLRRGNERYINNKLVEVDTLAEDRKILKQGQHPFAVVITCSDSRVSPEIYFDQTIGDLFVIRNAGNVVDETVLGSIEYAVLHLQSPLIVVVGHSSCGAVTAAISDDEAPGNIKSITDRIKKSYKEGHTIENLAQSHVNAMVEKIKKDSFVKDSTTKVVGAYYQILSGEIEWI